MGKGEVVRNEQFLLFPQCFLLNQIIVSPFVHIFDIISLFAAELEKPNTDKLGEGLSQIWVFFLSKIMISFFLLTDDDGDGQTEEDCATPPPSKSVFSYHFITWLRLLTSGKRSIMKALWEKEKLVTSIFSVSHNVCHLIKENNHNFSYCYFVD